MQVWNWTTPGNLDGWPTHRHTRVRQIHRSFYCRKMHPLLASEMPGMPGMPRASDALLAGWASKRAMRAPNMSCKREPARTFFFWQWLMGAESCGSAASTNARQLRMSLHHCQATATACQGASLRPEHRCSTLHAGFEIPRAGCVCPHQTRSTAGKRLSLTHMDVTPVSQKPIKTRSTMARAAHNRRPFHGVAEIIDSQPS